jgi:hypothetical protein
VAKIVRAEDPSKVESAREAGYSDDEIIEYLLKKSSHGCSRLGVNTTPLPQVLAMADGRAPSFLTEPWLGIGLVATCVSALAAFLVACSIGWLCAGFTRDQSFQSGNIFNSRCLLSGVKRKCAKGTGMSPFDPMRTLSGIWALFSGHGFCRYDSRCFAWGGE